MNYLNKNLKAGKIATAKKAHQSEPIPGRKTAMAQNNAGGYAFKIDQWKHLERFLILGSEGGTYYCKEKELTKENTTNLRKCIKDDGPRTVAMIERISDEGRAPKNIQAIYALALCLSEGDTSTKTAARMSAPKICRIGTHWFQLMALLKSLRGWGRVARKVIAQFYTKNKLSDLAYQVIKYRQREKWTHRDALRVSHPKTKEEPRKQLFNWIVKQGEVSLSGSKLPSKDLRIIEGYEEAQKCEITRDTDRLIKLIKEYNLPREALPTAMLKDKKVWSALLPGMPITALIRNLSTITRLGVVKPLSKELKLVTDKLTDEKLLKKGRVHPLVLVNALKTYASGEGFRGNTIWDPIPKIVDALNDAFYMAFKQIEPTRKRFLLGIDVSGSMSFGKISGMNICPAEGAAIMAMATARVEDNYHIMGFSSHFKNLGITKKMRLDTVTKRINDYNFGSTDCSVPMLYAMKNGLEVDTFVVYTDNETWYGDIHPAQALEKYRQKSGIPAKLVVVGMTSTGFSIADPEDPGMLDIVGFDTNCPSIISDFSK